MSLSKDLLTEFDRDFTVAAADIAKCFITKVRADPRVPVDTGLLRAGIQLIRQDQREGVIVQTIVDETTSEEGFDYPTHLDEQGRTHQGWWGDVLKDEYLQECLDKANLDA